MTAVQAGLVGAGGVLVAVFLIALALALTAPTTDATPPPTADVCLPVGAGDPNTVKPL